MANLRMIHCVIGWCWSCSKELAENTTAIELRKSILREDCLSRLAICSNCAEDIFLGLPKVMAQLKNEYPEINNARKYLWPVFSYAIVQAESGKGNERHGHGQDFMEQDWVTIAETHGEGFLLGQAQKKIMEAAKMKDREAKSRELFGAMNYLAMACLHIESRVDRDGQRGNIVRSALSY